MTTEFLTDAQAMHREHPDTFDVPTDEEIAALRIGDFVKVCAGRERFWVQIEEFDCDEIVGTVANALIFSAEHGFELDDEVRVERRHIYDTSPRSDQAA